LNAEAGGDGAARAGSEVGRKGNVEELGAGDGHGFEGNVAVYRVSAIEMR
jgi:hypothetical protein